MYVCVGVRVHVLVCICERERKRKRDRGREGQWVIQWVSVCGCVHVFLVYFVAVCSINCVVMYSCVFSTELGCIFASVFFFRAE